MQCTDTNNKESTDSFLLLVRSTSSTDLILGGIDQSACSASTRGRSINSSSSTVTRSRTTSTNANDKLWLRTNELTSHAGPRSGQKTRGTWFRPALNSQHVGAQAGAKKNIPRAVPNFRRRCSACSMGELCGSDKDLPSIYSSPPFHPSTAPGRWIRRYISLRFKINCFKFV
jgi:hypothetical protein